MENDSFNQNNINNNTNMSQSNIDYEALTAELHSYYVKYRSSNNKKEMIKGIMQNTDFSKLFNKLISNNYNEELMYLLENYEFQNKQHLAELFFLSIEKNKNKIVEYLIKNDFINLQETRDKEGNTGLIASAIFSNVQAAKIILKFDGTIVELKNNHSLDALTISVYNNDTLMFFLIANNLTIPILNLSFLTKLSIRNENLDILKFLLVKNSNLFNEDETFLHYACAQRSMEILKFVIKNYKNFDYKDESEETALHWAIMKGNYHIIEELINHLKDNNCEINPRNKVILPLNEYGVTPFHLACLKQDKHVAHLLFDNGADVNEQDNHGNTAFMVACIAGKYDIVKYFMDKIPSLNWKNNKGQTPLHAVVFGGHLHILELLLTHKADITVKDINALTAYHYAYAEKKADVIEVIHKILGLDAEKLKR